MDWKDIKSIPDTSRQVLVGFQGQFSWYSYVVMAYGEATNFGSHARPTHWTEIVPPKGSLNA